MTHLILVTKAFIKDVSIRSGTYCRGDFYPLSLPTGRIVQINELTARYSHSIYPQLEIFTLLRRIRINNDRNCFSSFMVELLGTALTLEEIDVLHLKSRFDENIPAEVRERMSELYDCLKRTMPMMLPAGR